MSFEELNVSLHDNGMHVFLSMSSQFESRDLLVSSHTAAPSTVVAGGFVLTSLRGVLHCLRVGVAMLGT
jgi:hypothetical protein